MSYILDALKKAERERTQVKVPTLTTVHPTSWAPPRQLWLWIVAAVVLVNAAALIWFLRPGPMSSRTADSTLTPAPPPATASAPPAPPADRAAPASSPEKAGVVATAPPEPTRPRASSSGRSQPETAAGRAETKPGASAARTEPRNPKAAEAPASPTPPAAPEKPAVPTAAPPIPPVAAAPDKPAAPPSAATPERPAGRGQASLPALRDMTPADQEAITKMTLQFLVYSDVPAERLVFINNQKYVEGQLIDGKVMVEGILPDGAVLSYQGKRFILR